MTKNTHKSAYAGFAVFLLAVLAPALSYATTYATWNPSDKSTDVSLSGGNLVVAKSLQNWPGGVRSTIGKASGKWYWEVTVTTAHADRTYCVGAATASASLVSTAGCFGAADNLGWSYYGNTGNRIYSTNTSAACGATYTTGDVIGLALDVDAGTLAYYKNGSLQCTQTGLTGTIYAGANVYDTTGSLTANFGASAFSYSVPAGFCSGLVDTCPGATPIAATSSLEQTQQNLFNALVVFFVSFFGMIWLLRKH